MITTKKSIALALTAALGTSGAAFADTHVFAMQPLNQGYLVADSDTKAKDGTCGGDKAQEAKCAAAKDAAKTADGKCGEGKCGASEDAADPAKASDGKCGEGKCGAADQAKSSKENQ